MNVRDFETLFNATVAECNRVLNAKNAEYADDTDKLHNFKAATGTFCKEPEFALWGMLNKHLVSIVDNIKKIEEQNGNSSVALWNEKLHDALNYLFLLKALVWERYEFPIAPFVPDTHLPEPPVAEIKTPHTCVKNMQTNRCLLCQKQMY